MSKKINATSLGVFIFIGLVLGVSGLMLFTSSKLFKNTTKFIVYFDTSLNGLKEGAPVKYRGVNIGSVSRVMIHFNQANTDRAMPVILELQEDLIRERLVGATIFQSLDDLGVEVAKGLRASLETESLVTGVLYVSLEVENNPSPPVYHQTKAVYTEIPSKPTDIEQMMKNLARLDLAGLEQRISSLVAKLDNVVGSVRMDQLVEGVTNLLVSVNSVLKAPDLTNSFTSFKTALDQYRLLAENINRRVDPLADGLTNTINELNRTLAQTRVSMRDVRNVLAPDSPLRHDLTIALDRLAEASQSVAALADFLSSNPNALITGRKAAADKP